MTGVRRWTIRRGCRDPIYDEVEGPNTEPVEVLEAAPVIEAVREAHGLLASDQAGPNSGMTRARQITTAQETLRALLTQLIEDA